MFSFFKKKKKKKKEEEEEEGKEEVNVEEVAELIKSLQPVIPTLRAWSDHRFNDDSKKILQVFDVVKYDWVCIQYYRMNIAHSNSNLIC
jgi:hypothetical protein